MKKQLQDLKQEFLNYPTKRQKYKIDDRKFVVVSHFVGNKDINEILKRLAIKQAYSEN